MHRTKIVSTIGPVSDSEEVMAALMKAGADVFRFNMKHGDVAWHEERIKRAQKVADELGRAIGILIDLQGPEIRIETLDKEPMQLEKDEEVILATDFVEGKKTIRVADEGVINALSVGDEVLIDDGFMEFDVIGEAESGLRMRARANYTVTHRKGMNLPGIKLDLASLIDDDLKKLDMASREHVDFVALSFVRDAEDIRILREEMKRRSIDAHVVAKVENAAALENIDEIIESSDSIMIARGDLGIEVPYEELAYWQKKLIYKCRRAEKPVITATQMLQSMVDSPRPTRAEVTDVANAVFDGSDAVMLSGETAQGKYPAGAVAAMRRIVEFNEDKVILPPLSDLGTLDQTEAITHAAMNLVSQNTDYDIAGIVVFTETGNTARALSRFRPGVPLIALTQDEKVRDELMLAYGVSPILTEFPEGDIISVDPVIEHLKEQGVVKTGQRLLFVHGHRWSEPGLTNTLALKEVK
ncbi:pyruvate kinase [Candidatus Woesebacteria bacterium]|nr:pyruvate kinase [Candidatus Woesebacteria bacterium]MCD8507180.1 pyruvate kinase [Candidatus Woesebacteria bacterium]MCD8527073.1 pyruvate kinase [Candidatus Woesebacteria bacterium]MCD8545926.1 pyruvate kinase [Candidatus Woesebacteria bacterium]